MPRRKDRAERQCKAEDCLLVIPAEAHALRLYCSNECMNRQNHRNVDRRSRYAAYGATLDDYDRLLMEQDGRCAICGSDSPGSRKVSTRFAFDHDHATNRPRGLLCYLCNVGLGSFQDDITTLQNAIAYLTTHTPGAAINPGLGDDAMAVTPHRGE
jgi:hypothetical protein